MANAAVMGVLGPLRHILLTDLLLVLLDPRHLEAVTAHELAHARRHHLFWLLLLVTVLLAALHQAARLAGPLPPGGAMAVALLVLPLPFGGICRRLERQADASAARRLAVDDGADRITAEAAGAVGDALQRITNATGADPRRGHWLHDSVHARQTALAAMVGHPLDAHLPADRAVRRMQAAGLGGALALLALGIAGV
jgi:Zn-dependent protease with chaperone function